MERRREREQFVEPGLLESFAHRFAAMHEIEALLRALERPRETQDCADAAEADEVQLIQVDGHGIGAGIEPLLDGAEPISSSMAPILSAPIPIIGIAISTA